MPKYSLQTLEQDLVHHLKMIVPNHSFREVYEYAVLPPGKLFRPLLVHAIHNDLDITSEVSNNHRYFSSFIEIHHAYTLVHDDLPCMDDDDMRRGKPSTHKAYGEWQAVLAGDGLLNGSYQLLSKIEHQNLHKLFKLATWSLGAKGLIHGQVIDLSEEMNQSFDQLILTHKLKTARLIQLALVGSYLLLDQGPIYRTTLDLGKLGHHLGIAFQLLDDLSELADTEIGHHETEVNPWPKDFKIVSERLQKDLSIVNDIIKKYELTNLQDTLANYYFSKMYRLLDKDIANVLKRLDKGQADLLPIMLLLQSLSKTN